jgi:hypothetical protein
MVWNMIYTKGFMAEKGPLTYLRQISFCKFCGFCCGAGEDSVIFWDMTLHRWIIRSKPFEATL